MITGVSPFSGENVEKLKENLNRGTYNISIGVLLSAEALDLI